MKKARKIKLLETLETAVAALEFKCGGPGGTPGPCPGGGSGSKPKRRPRRYPATFTGLGREIDDSLDAIAESRGKILRLVQKIGFKPTSKDPWINEQQAIEWFELRQAQGIARKPAPKPKPTSQTPASKPKPKPKPGEKPKPKEKPKPASTEKPKPKPEPKPKPGEAAADVAPEVELLTSNEARARAIVKMASIPQSRRVNTRLPEIKQLSAKSKPKEVLKVIGKIKANVLWPNRKKTASELLKSFKSSFTDDNAEAVIQQAVSHVRSFFSKEGGAARIMTFLKGEKEW